MNPFFIRNRLHPYLDDELSETERIEMEEALEQHPDILRELQQLEQQEKHLKNQGQTKAPADLFSSIMAEIEELPAPQAKMMTLRTAANNIQWYMVIAVALVLFVVLIPNEKKSGSPKLSDIHPAQTLPIPNQLSLPPPTLLEPKHDQKKETREISAPKDDSTNIETKHIKPQKKKEQGSKTTTSPALRFVITETNSTNSTTWEQPLENTIAKAAEEAYQYRQAEADALFTLNTLAKQAQGSLLTSQGVEVSPVNLTVENGYQSVIISVPKENYSTVDEKLRQLGAVFSRPTLPVEDGYVRFPIEVYYKYY